MRRISSLSAFVILTLLSTQQSAAVNQVRIDTVSFVPPGTNDLSIGVYITNDLPIAALVLPLEIRTCDGAYISGPGFSHGMNQAGRLYNSALSPTAHPNALWPAAIYVQSTFAAPQPSVLWYQCWRNESVQSAWTLPAAAPDFVSPDAMLMATVSTGDPAVGEESELYPGSDPVGVPSYTITVNVGQTPGIFVIDSTCIAPGNKLRFVVNDDFWGGSLVYPSFQPGIIGVGVGIAGNLCESVQCACPCHGTQAGCTSHPSGILDVVTTIDVAFRGVPESRTANCPVPNTDMNCSGATDVVDVVKSILVEFRGSDPSVEYCSPCGASR